MKYIFTLLLAVLTSAVVTAQETPYVEGEILVKLEKGTDIQDWVNSARSETQTTSIRAMRCLNRHLNYWQLSFNPYETEDAQLKQKLMDFEGVMLVQFNHYVTSRETVPNDELFGNQWHHIEDGDHDIDTDAAWDITTGGMTATGDEIVACVIEGGGASWNHEDLLANHWTNENEIPDNGIDDDGNGYVDDYDGWNPTNETDNIPGGNHGTQVSSMIGSVGNDEVGVAGVNWDVKIMQVTVGSLNEANVVAAYEYPMTLRMTYNETGGAEGAFVVVTNASWGIDGGDPENSPIWCDYYDALGEEGILNCGATANNNVDIDVVGDLPTGCDSDYMISVTATNDNDVRTFSGYGATTIDLGAPGEDVYMARNTNAYGTSSGTSFASPCVAGGIALMYSAPCPSFAAIAAGDPQEGANMIRQYLFDGVDLVDNLTDECVTGGRMNINNSIQLMLETCADGGCLIPFAVNFQPAEGGDFILGWGAIEGMDSFDVRYRAVGDELWEEMNDLDVMSIAFTDLEWCTEYEFQLASNCSEEEDSEYSISYFYTTDGCCVAPTADELIVQEISQESVSLAWVDILAAETYILEYRVAGTTDWTIVDGISELSVEVEGLTPCETYEFRMSSACAEGDSDYTAVLEIDTYGCGACTDFEYCTAEGESTSDEWLESIEIGEYENVSGNNQGYEDFGNLDWTLVSGNTYPIVLTPGFSGTDYNEYFKIYIDINEDGDFEDANELIFDSGDASPDVIEADMTIPSGIEGESLKMRVIMKWVSGFGGTEPEPCEEFGYGEVEDYCVNITASDNVTDLENFTGLNVYPNPVQDVLNFEADQQSIQRVEIYDAASGLVYSERMAADRAQVPVNQLAAGFYTYRVILSNGMETQGKFVKK